MTTTPSATTRTAPGRRSWEVELLEAGVVEAGVVVPAVVLRDLRRTVNDLERWLNGYATPPALASFDRYFCRERDDELAGAWVKALLADHHRALTDLLVNGELVNGETL